jgi:hypothetical protein
VSIGHEMYVKEKHSVFCVRGRTILCKDRTFGREGSVEGEYCLGAEWRVALLWS